MKLSETFEGDNSSLKKTFEEVVYEATPFSPGVLTVGGPAQKKEKATASTKILKGVQLHRNDCPVRFVNCICKFGADEILDEVKNMVNGDAQKDTLRSKIEEIVMEDEEHIKALIKLAEARGREATITLFEEFAKDNESNNKGYGEDGYVTLTDLLSFADSLKSNAPKV